MSGDAAAGLSPVEIARGFVDAILWGAHHRIWELLSPPARDLVLESAQRRGMDAVAAARARNGTWGVEESDEFLSALVRGLRVDLSGVELGAIEVLDDPEVHGDGALRYRLESASVLPPVLTGGANWAAGAVVVGRFDGCWQVVRLEPRPVAGTR